MVQGDMEYRLLESFSRMKHISFWEITGQYNRSEMHLLGAACCNNADKIKVSELCSVTGMQPAAVSRCLRSLEQNGLIERSFDPDNRRCVMVSVTQEGKKKAEIMLKSLHDYWSDVLTRMSVEDLETMLRIWNKVMDNMEAVLVEKKMNS